MDAAQWRSRGGQPNGDRCTSYPAGAHVHHLQLGLVFFYPFALSLLIHIYRFEYFVRHNRLRRPDIPGYHERRLCPCLPRSRQHQRRLRSRGLPDRGLHIDVRICMISLHNDLIIHCVCRYSEAYNNPNYTLFSDIGEDFPGNSFLGDC